MRVSFAGPAALALAVAAAGCATQGAPSPMPPSSVYCDPCPMPCTHDQACGGAVAARPAPAPAPAPVPAPAPAPAPAPKAAGVHFDPPGGTYASAQDVKLTSATHGAAIHYTTDGSEPTAASPAYSGPIHVGSSTTVKAVAKAHGMADSGTASAAYAIQPPPPAAPARVAIAKGKIELKEKVYFDTGKTTIKSESHSLLDEAAALIKDHPELKKVVIEGHTDDRGAADFNKQLSQGRADAVRSYLVGKGVEGGRLEAKGFGSSRPIADNKTAKGREANRRVEFVIAP